MISSMCVSILTAVTEGVVHGVYKVVIRSSFGLIQRHKANGGTWTFRHFDARLHMNLKRLLKDRGFCQMRITLNYTACSVNNWDKMGPPGRWFCRRRSPVTAGCTVCTVKGGIRKPSYKKEWALRYSNTVLLRLLPLKIKDGL